MKITLLIVLAVAAPFYGRSFSANPDSAAIYLQKALSLKESRRPTEAATHFEKAINFNPRDTKLRITYSNFLIAEKKYALAAEQLQIAIAENGSNPLVLQKLSEVSFYLHRWKDVIASETNAAANGSFQSHYYRLGKAYFEENEYELAEKTLLLAIDKKPSDGASLLLLGKVYAQTGSYKQAIIAYNLALNTNGSNASLLYELGLLYATISNEKEAVKFIEMASEKGYKTDLNYKQNLGLAYLSVDLNKGLNLLSQVLEQKPNDSEILLQMAHANFRSKNYKVAAHTFYKIYESDLTNNIALYMTGKAYQKNGERSLGKSLCDKAIQYDPALVNLKLLKYGD